MFNIAVINIKDIGKYLIKVIILLIVIAFIINFFNEKDKKNISNKTWKIFDNTFLKCIDLTLPRTKNIKIANNNNKSILEEILKLELKLAKNIELPDGSIVKETEISQEDRDELIIPKNVTTEVLESSVKERYTNSYGSVQIKNETDFGLTEEMLTPNAGLTNKNSFLIYHTHTCESYTKSENYNYEMTGNFRTTNLDYSVARVGKELKKYLEMKQCSVIHDVTYHDSPAYSGSYDRSLITASNILQQNKDIQIAFDIHRDAIGDNTYAPTVKIGEEYAAQLMFVIGTNGGGLEHPNWLQNLKVAVQIQQKANEKYPGLFKPIILRNSRYNQHLAIGSCIIEVGATGNTLDQCITSMKYLADVLSQI